MIFKWYNTQLISLFRFSGLWCVFKVDFLQLTSWTWNKCSCWFLVTQKQKLRIQTENIKIKLKKVADVSNIWTRRASVPSSRKTDGNNPRAAEGPIKTSQKQNIFSLHLDFLQLLVNFKKTFSFCLFWALSGNSSLLALLATLQTFTWVRTLTIEKEAPPPGWGQRSVTLFSRAAATCCRRSVSCLFWAAGSSSRDWMIWGTKCYF